MKNKYVLNISYYLKLFFQLTMSFKDVYKLLMEISSSEGHLNLRDNLNINIAKHLISSTRFKYKLYYFMYSCQMVLSSVSTKFI